MKERLIQKAIADAINLSAEWPTTAPVIVAEPGNVITQIETDLGKTGLCAIVGEPDQMESVYGASGFVQSSDWVISVFTSEIMNSTQLDNLSACLLIRKLLGETNPSNLFAEPISRFRIRYTGMHENVVARDVTFQAAYQS